MADCPSCQSSMSSNADFCGHCGSRMTAGAEPTWHRDNADVAPEEEREAADTVNQQKPTVPRSEDQDILEQIGRAVAKQLAGGKDKEKIVKEFVKDGWTEESATLFVEEVDAQPAGTWVFYAGFWQRFGAYLLDYLIVLVIAGIPAILVAWITYEAERPAVHTFFTQDQEDAAVTTATGAFVVVGLIVTIVYLWIGNSFGGTLGKRAFGLRVVSASDGGNIGLERGLNRIFVYVLGSIALNVGWLWMVGDDQKQTWHDKAAGSIVIRKRQVRPVVRRIAL